MTSAHLNSKNVSLLGDVGGAGVICVLPWKERGLEKLHAAKCPMVLTPSDQLIEPSFPFAFPSPG